MIIYKTTNLVNGKIYIGQDSRDNPKYLGSGVILAKAIKKNGYANFKKETLEICESKVELNAREKFWIVYFDAMNPEIGYNLTEGGEGSFGFKHSEETIQKISGKNNSFYGKKHTKETKERIRQSVSGKNNYWYGRELSKEHINKISKIKKIQNKGKSNPFYGKHHTEENKRKYSENQKGEKSYCYGKHPSEETIFKLTKYHIPKEELYQLYIIQNKTQKEIAKIYKCGKSTIGYKLNKYNIKRK